MMDWCQTLKGPATFKAGVGLQQDPVYVYASYMSDEHIKNSILEIVNFKKETDDLIHKLVTDSENAEANKDALLASQNKLKTSDLIMSTNNSILLHIEDHRKPSMLEYVLHKMKRFTQSCSKKKVHQNAT